MNTPKLIFSLQELPDGESRRNVSLVQEDLELKEGVSLLDADVEVEFFKTDHFVQVKFAVAAETELICDRTLQPFSKHVEGSYLILFEPDPEEETETERETVRRIPADELVLSIGKEVRDTILLNLPARRIHPSMLDEDGKPEEFETQKFGKAPEGDQIDPRWEELKKLKKK